MSKAEKREVAIHLKTINDMRAGLLQAQGQLADFRKHVTEGFKQAGKIIGAALIGGLTAATLVGANFEQAMANVGSVTNATTEQMAQLEAKAREMGATTAFSAAEAAGAMYSLASAGLDTANIIGTSEAVLKLAGATMSDMGQTAELVTASMKQFGLSAEDSTRIANTLAAGTQASMLTMDRLANSLKYAGSIAPTVNMSLEETVAVMGLMVDKGLDASQAGTGFRSMMLQLLDPSADLKAALGGVSITTDGLAAVIRQLGTVSATELPKLFQAESFSAVNALVRSGAEAFEAMTKRVTGTSAAFEMYERQMATTQGRFAILKSAIQEDLIAAFLEIKPTIDEVLEKLTAFVTEAKPMLVEMAGNVVAAFKALKEVLTDVFGFMSQNKQVLGGLSIAFGIMTGSIYAVATALSVASKAMGIFIAISNLNPVVLVITLVIAGIGMIVAGITLAIRKFDSFKEAAVSALWDVKIATAEVQNFFMQLPGGRATLDAMYRMRDEMLNSLRPKGEILDEWTDMRAKMGVELKAIQGLFANFWKGPKQPEKVSVPEIGSPVVGGGGGDSPEALASRYQTALAGFRDNAAAASEIFRSMWQGQPVNRIIRDLDEVRRASRSTFQIMRDDIHAALTELGDFSKYTSANVKVAVADTFTAMADGIGAAVEDSKRKLIDLEGLARGVFGSLLAGLAKFAIGSGLSSLGPWGAGVASLMGFEKKADGGSIYPGQPYLVGERGPELRMFGSSGTIINNDQLRALAAGGGGGMNVSVQVNLPSSSIMFADNRLATRRFSEQIAREITEKVNKTFRES